MQVEITSSISATNPQKYFLKMARCKCSPGGLPELGRNILEVWMSMAGVINCGLLSTCLLSFSPFSIGVLMFAAWNNLPSCHGCGSGVNLKCTDGHEVTASMTGDFDVMSTEDDEVMATNDDGVTTTVSAVQATNTDDINPETRPEDAQVTCPEDAQVTCPEDAQVTCPGNLPGTSSEDTSDLDCLPSEILGRIFQRVPYEQIFQLKAVSTKLKGSVESNQFLALPQAEKPTLTACYFFIENQDWHWAGFDLSSRRWRRMPSLDLKFLPANCKPDPDLFKEFLICAKDGLVCINFSKSTEKERLIVFNPLSRKYRELPAMTYRRNPVLMNMLVDSASQSYQVIVAGSSKSGDEDLSKITEMYDSRTGKWTRMGDLPGPAYAVNEFQTGVFHEGKIFCIGFVEDNDQVSKGILGYDVEEGRWSTKWTHTLSFCTLSSTILQLVESNGVVYLFSERENAGSIEHWVDRLEWILGNGDEKNTCMLFNVIRKKKLGGRSLEVYPEYVCVPYSEGHLCILNAIDHTGVVHDIRNQEQSEFPLETLPEKGFKGELGFFGLNPMSFMVEPRFSIKV
ncbi:hypothetical protein M758_7G103600 [Ceratodon purpureus]|nr:hypothetical protein M758_7G103600 [Ceratodon purpureus]